MSTSSQIECPQCKRTIAAETPQTVCPHCGEALPERDHRGIVLPKRHAVGGIITPQ